MGYCRDFNNLCNEAISALKEKLNTLPNKTFKMPEDELGDYYLFIDNCNGSTYGFSVGTVIMDNGTVYFFREEENDDDIDAFFNPNLDKHLDYDSYVVLGNAEHIEWDGLLDLIDRIVEE